MALGRDALELQNKISYTFFDLAYLDTAMTHSSYTNELRQKGMKAESNQRLEFLGDAVLQLVISAYLYENFSSYREGALTKMRQELVCEKLLARIAKKIELGEYINLGYGEEQADIRNNSKILADALEALIAAIYLDSLKRGDEEYKQVILRLFADEIKNSPKQKTDFKTRLQQLAEQDGMAVLEYRIISEQGPEHDKSFTVAAFVNNNEVGRGSGKTKKLAEMQAAEMALRLFGVL